MYTEAGDFHYLAAYTIQLLELLQTFDKEVKWIWRKPWTWINCTFLFVRYGTLVSQAAILYHHFYAAANPRTHSQCIKWAIFRTISPYIFLACIQSILVARVYALYNRNRRLLFALASLLVVSNICIVALFARMFSYPTEWSPRCEVRHIFSQGTFTWACILPFVLDLAILVLTIKRALSLDRGPHPIPILRTVIIDGTWSVFVIWSTVVGALIFSAAGYLRVSYVVANSWLVTMLSFVVTHTIFNLRKYETPSLRYPYDIDSRRERYEMSLTTYVPAEGTVMLTNRDGAP